MIPAAVKMNVSPSWRAGERLAILPDISGIEVNRHARAGKANETFTLTNVARVLGLLYSEL